MEGMVNICELLVNVVTPNKPKRLFRLEPKGKRTSIEVLTFSIADVAPLAKRQDLTLQVVIRRNVVSSVSLPSGKASRKASR